MVYKDKVNAVSVSATQFPHHLFQDWVVSITVCKALRLYVTLSLITYHGSYFVEVQGWKDTVNNAGRERRWNGQQNWSQAGRQQSSEASTDIMTEAKRPKRALMEEA